MRFVRRILPLAGIAIAVSVAIVAACSDPGQATRPPIPTISAQTAGTVYCAEWSCSYDFCHLRPDWNGYSCCVEKTLEPGSEQPRPTCVSVPDCPSTKTYALNPGADGIYGSWGDDYWYCPYSCCAAGSGDPTKYRDPMSGQDQPNHNCPSTGGSCNYPNKP